MHRSIPLIVLCVSVLAAACAGPSQAARPDAEQGAAAVASSTTTVLVLGTLHEAHLGGGYSLDVIEDVVRGFRPDVVLVELPPDAVASALSDLEGVQEPLAHPPTGPWIRSMPELYAVVLPLRHELGFEVVGISGMDAAAVVAREAYYRDAPHGPMQRAYLVANASLHAAYIGSEGPRNPAWLHGPEFEELSRDATLWLAYFAEEEMGPGGALRVQARSAGLLDAALDAAPGQRVLVVYDVAARWWIESAVDVRGDAERLDVRAFLPGVVSR